MFNLLMQIVVPLVLVGVVLWALTQFPIDATIIKVIRVVIVVFAVFYVVYLLQGLPNHPHGISIH